MDDLAVLKNALLLCLPAAAKQDGFDFLGTIINTPTFPSEALKYRESFKDLLRTLCSYSPTQRNTDDFLKKHSAFLTEHLGHVRLTLDVVPLGREYYVDPAEYVKRTESEKYHSESGEMKSSPLGLMGLSFGGQDIADPLCEFIVRELERVREADERLPIFICEACDQLFVPHRVKTEPNKFCGRRCKDSKHGQAGRVERTAEQFLKRLAGFDPKKIQAELAKEGKRNKYEHYKQPKIAPTRSICHIKKIDKALARATRATLSR